MKRIFKVICAAFFIFILPVSLAAGQDRKSEQKIKIIVNDGSGTKILVDTLIKDSPGTDSLKLRDGSVVYLKHKGDEPDIRHNKDRDHVSVTYSSNGKDDGKEYKEVTIITSDSSEMTNAGNGNNVTYYTKSERHEGRGGQKYKVITRNYKDGEKGETINIYADNDNDSTMDKCKYVIAKDGMVVTVEGNDDAKAKALVKEIENTLGVKSEGTVKKETVKVESQKTIKK